ncbi:MAG: hypothetical protein ACYC26_04205 [Phycisphaerales bacterium]
MPALRSGEFVIGIGPPTWPGAWYWWAMFVLLALAILFAVWLTRKHVRSRVYRAAMALVLTWICFLPALTLLDWVDWKRFDDFAKARIESSQIMKVSRLGNAAHYELRDSNGRNATIVRFPPPMLLKEVTQPSAYLDGFLVCFLALLIPNRKQSAPVGNELSH